MTPEAIAFMKDKWIPALRSGEYLQTAGVLMTNIETGKVGYCCLGVLCAIREDVESDYDGKDAMFPVEFRHKVEIDGEEVWSHSDELLPETLAEAMGITPKGEFFPYFTIDGMSSISGTYMNLTELNDRARYTFAEIADFVEDLLDPDTERSFV